MSAVTDGARRKARELAFRVSYQCDLVGDSIGDTWDTLRAEQELSRELSDDQVELVDDVVRALSHHAAQVDEALRAAAEHWPLERLAATDRAVLRAAIAELLARPGTPARVVLDEAIEIARRYGSDESGRFVNGVLDRVARTLRPGEFS